MTDRLVLDVDTFLAGLDSPLHSDESRRAWVHLFWRDLQRPGVTLPPDPRLAALLAAAESYRDSVRQCHHCAIPEHDALRDALAAFEEPG